MNSPFDEWFTAFLNMRRCAAGRIGGVPQEVIESFEARLDEISGPGHDAEKVARALIAIERARKLAGESQYSLAMQELERINLDVGTSRSAARHILATRDLIEAGILYRQNRVEDAMEKFIAVTAVQGILGADVRAEAWVSIAMYVDRQGDHERALKVLDLAATEFVSIGYYTRTAHCWHKMGNIHRDASEFGAAVTYYGSALDHFIQTSDLSGQLTVYDDWSRLFLFMGAQVQADDPTRAMEYFNMGFAESLDAAFIALQMWRDPHASERHLANFSQRLLHHTMTHCELARVTRNAHHLLGTLAVNKGRIRATRTELPSAALESASELNKIALERDDPPAYWQLVVACMPHLNERGEKIAIVDQLGLWGDVLLSAVTVFGGPTLQLQAYPSFLHQAGPTRPHAFQGTNRCADVEELSRQLFRDVDTHIRRCEYLLRSCTQAQGTSQRTQLERWAEELKPSLEQLGRWFFPEGLLHMLRDLSVTHVVLVPDPLFATIPYPALETSAGAVVDQPWSLSLVTSAVELVRVAHRRVSSETQRHLTWMGPDAEVNANLGGNEEENAIADAFTIESFKGTAATLDRATSALAGGNWVHFRGHGSWTGNIETSGPVFANSQVLDRAALERTSGGGFLFTAACHTGFTSAVGTEAFGSFVDYDRAGLKGAILTRWPIHGPASVPFIQKFYRALSQSGHVARAIREAELRTRELSPHPCIWAPFAALGAWEVAP